MFDAFLAIEGTFNGKLNGMSLCNTIIEISDAGLKEVNDVTRYLFARLLQAAMDLVVLENIQNMRGFQDEVVGKLDTIKDLTETCQKHVKTKAWKIKWKLFVEKTLKKHENNADDCK